MNATFRVEHRRSLWMLLMLLTIHVMPGCGDAPGEPGNGAPDEGRGAVHAGEIHLTPEQEAAAGITVATAGPGKLHDTLRLVARVATNADTEAHVNPRVGGIVRVIHKGLGDSVAAGDLLVEIDSVELGNAVADYLKDKEQLAAAEETLKKETALFEKRIQTQTRVADGAIQVAQRIYDREKSLQEKAIATLRPFLEADKALQEARLTKERDLTRLRAERDARQLQLQVALRQARIDLGAAVVRLGILGLGESEVAAISRTRSGGLGQFGRLVIKAPIDGVVVARHLTLNEFVDSNTTLFQIEDLSKVWILASVYEKDLARLSVGKMVRVRLNALPGTDIHGELSFIDYRIAATTRTAAVRIVVDNEKLKGWPVAWPIRPGMFGTADVIINSRQAGVVVPEESIVHEGAFDFVFVAEPDEERTYVKRPVRIQQASGSEFVEVVAGLTQGEKIAVKGTFYLKSLSKKGDLGEGHEH